MIVKFITIKKAESSIIKLAKSKLSQKYLYRVKFLVKALREIEDERVDIIKKYNPDNIDLSVKDDNSDKISDGIIVRDDSDDIKNLKQLTVDTIHKEFKEFLEEETEIKFLPIPIADLENIELDSMDYLDLEPFIEGEL
jgi:hypothetical protein